MILDTLLMSTDPIISEAARHSAETIDAFNSQKINAEEYADLMNTILDQNKVASVTDDLNRQNAISYAFSQIKEIAGAVSALTSL